MSIQYKPNMQNNLFQDFDPVNKEQWIAKAIKGLKGKDFHQSLVTKTVDGIDILPFYTSEDGASSKTIKTYQNRINPEPEIPGLSPRLWSNVFCPYESDAKVGNKLILEALMNGCDALLVHVFETTHFSELLRNVEIPYIQLFIKPAVGADPIKVINGLLAWIEEKDWAKEQLNGGLLWDGTSYLLKEKGEVMNQVYQIKNLIDSLESYPNFSAHSLDFSVYHEAGASTVQELKYGFSSFIELLHRLSVEGFEVEKVFKNTVLVLSVGSQYFEEISKLRAARIFFDALAGLYKVKLSPEEINLFCQTSSWTKSKLDVHTNMLRNTTEGMSAILGGCNALWVRPHDEVTGISTTFSQRMARNISNILKEETYLDKVVDPVAGSYFIENLSVGMLEMLKSELSTLESTGGWWENYSNNIIQKSVKAFRKERQQSVLEGHFTKVGANKYRQDKEALSFGIKPVFEEAEWQLLGARETELVEEKNAVKS